MKILLDSGLDVETMIETNISDVKKVEIALNKMESSYQSLETDIERMYNKFDDVVKRLEEINLKVEKRDESIWTWIKNIFSKKEISSIKETTVDVDK
jgi:peptidoglycan hydrolase CwlO-like protein